LRLKLVKQYENLGRVCFGDSSFCALLGNALFELCEDFCVLGFFLFYLLLESVYFLEEFVLAGFGNILYSHQEVNFDRRKTSR